jgi:hypothetical protein
MVSYSVRTGLVRKQRREALTSACPGKLDKTQRRVVGGHWLEGNVAVPGGGALLLGAEAVSVGQTVELVVLDRADGTDLGIVASQLTFGVEKWVNVQCRRRRAAADISQLLNEDLLNVIGEVVLGPEEYHSPLGYCWELEER